MSSESIDDLLVRYLGLLDEYTQLRTSLAARQSAMYSHLARANFSAERGVRYGPDYYDGRMQALVKVGIAVEGDADVPTFSTTRIPTKTGSSGGSGEKDTKEEETEESKADKVEDKVKVKEAEKTEKTEGEKPEADTSTKTQTKTKPETEVTKTPKDPLGWFGILTPMALRQTQQEAITAVDTIIPRLASVEAEMAAVEIAVRRARKKRTKAEAARAKEAAQQRAVAV